MMDTAPTPLLVNGDVEVFRYYADTLSLTHVFEPLFTTKAKGIGLGLAISKVYAELNEGSLQVHSEPGRGARFCLLLPAAAGETEANPMPRRGGNG